VYVRLPQNALDPATGTATVILEPVAGKFNVPHARGALIQLVAPDPSKPPINLVPAAGYPGTGNPGPQPGFNYKAPRYAPVVRYAELLK
jgi:hypothetical protein